MNKKLDEIIVDTVERMPAGQANMVRAALEFAYWIGHLDGYNEAKSALFVGHTVAAPVGVKLRSDDAKGSGTIPV